MKAVAFVTTSVLILSLLISGCAKDDDRPDGPVETASQEVIAIVDNSTLSFFDPETERFLDGRFGVGDTPNWILASEDRIDVINSRSADIHRFVQSAGVITYVGRTDLGQSLGRNPWAATETANGQILVTDLLRNELLILRSTDLAALRVLPCGTAPEGVASSGNRAWAVSTGYDFMSFRFSPGYLYQFDLDSLAVNDSLPLPTNPQYVAVDARGRLHVTCTGDYSGQSGSIWILQTDPLRRVEQLDVEGFPGRIAIAPWGTAYVAAGGWLSDGQEQGIVLAYDIDSPEFIRTIPVGLGASDIAVSGDKVFVACSDASSPELDVLAADTLRAVYPLPDTPLALATWTLKKSD